MRELLKKDNEFSGDESHEQAFENLKNILTSKPGLGACELQNNLPCAYASKTLTETQTPWGKIEKELLAITFGLIKFHDYVYDKKLIVETDHLPLISIVKKPLNKYPARLQKMLLKLQKYDFEVRFKPGKQLIIANAL